MRNTSTIMITVATSALLQLLPAQTTNPKPESAREASPPQSSSHQAKPAKTGQQAPQSLMQGKVSKQKRRRHQSATTAVHSAWLTEIIDLDRKTAIVKYDKIIKDSTKKQPEKWIAVARLQELSRLGVIQPCLLYTSPSPRDRTRSRMPSSA